MALPSYDELVGTALPSYDELVKTDEEPSDTFAQDAPKTEPLSFAKEFGTGHYLNALAVALAKARDIGTEALSPIDSGLAQTVFGQTTASMRPEQISPPLISPSAARQIVGQLPEWAGGDTSIGRGIAEGAAGTLSAFSAPGALAQLPAFAVPGFAETYVLNTIHDLPDQGRRLMDAADKYGWQSKEVAQLATEYGIQDLTAFLAGKTSTTARFIKAEPRAELPQAVRRWPEPDAPIETEPVKTTGQVAKAEPLPEQPPQVPPVSKGDILIPVDERGQPHPSIASDVQRQKPVEGPVPQPEASTPEVESASRNTDEATGLPLNSDGTVTLYHGTTEQGATAIRESGALRSQAENAVYLTTEPSGTGYGDGTVVAVRVKPELLQIDDEFPNGRKDFRIEGRSAAVKLEPEPSVEGTAEQAPQVTTGVANRVLKAEAEAGKIEPVEPGEGMSWQEMVDLGREKLNAGADPQMIARRFQRNGRISAEDFAVVRAERERLAGETMAAENAVRQSPNDVNARNNYNAARQAETEWVRNVVQPAKTATSDIFRGMQGEAPIDPTTFAGLRRAVLDIHGRDVAPNEVGTLSAISERTRRAVAESSESLQRAASAVENTLGRKAKPRSIEELREHLANRIREITPCP